MSITVDQVYREYYDRLFTLAIRVTGEQAAAEDVLQNAFLSAIKSWDSFKQKSSHYTWLYTIVLNAARKYIKKEQLLPVDQYALESGKSIEEIYRYIGTFEELPDDHSMVNQTRETCLQMFLDCLPPKYRITYTLREILHCSVKESAEILENSENSVKIDLSRAKEMLRNHLQGRCSLVNRKGICNCRSFAGHVLATGKSSKVLDKSTIILKEKEAARSFNAALEEILDVNSLYDTNFRSIPFEKLKERVMKLSEEGENPLLS